MPHEKRIKLGRIHDVNLRWIVNPSKTPQSPQEAYISDSLKDLSLALFYERVVMTSDKVPVTGSNGEKIIQPVKRTPDYIAAKYVNEGLPFFPRENKLDNFPVVGIELTGFERGDFEGYKRKQVLHDLAIRIGMPMAFIFRDEELDFIDIFLCLQGKEQRRHKARYPNKNLDVWSVLAQTVNHWVTKYEPSKRTDSAA